MSQSEDKRLQPIWNQLAKKLGAQELPERVRVLLLRDHETAINLALGTGDPDDLEPLIPIARSVYSAALDLRGPRRRRKKTLGESSKEIAPRVGHYENLRAEVLSEYLAKMTSMDPRVAEFRTDVLAGELLSPEQARAFLSSPATRYLGRNIWQTYGIPAKHTAMLLDESFGRAEDGPFHWVRIRTDTPAEEHAVFIPNPQTYDNLTYSAEDGRPKRITFWPGSVLGNLRKLCKELVKGHPWDIDEATWFVLTGEIPLVRPIRARISSSSVLGGRAYSTISLTVQPWVPPETVEIAYRQLQKQVIGGDFGRIGEKNLKLLRFVTKRADGNGNLPKGRDLVPEWDRQCKATRPEWCYGADTRRFWRDFRSAQESVTNSTRAGILQEWWPEYTSEAAE